MKTDEENTFSIINAHNPLLTEYATHPIKRPAPGECSAKRYPIRHEVKLGIELFLK